MRSFAVVAAALLVLFGCSRSETRQSARGKLPSSAPSTAIGGGAPVPTTSATPSTTSPVFTASVREIDDATAARMAASWRPGCPVALADLRLLELAHWSFEGALRTGELVVHEAHAEGVVGVFRQLFTVGFRIEQMRLVDEFDGNDDASMAANNTSGFNCRRATGSSRWSEHAYGRAIDINPVQNPFVTAGGTVLPPAGEAYVGREGTTPGLITAQGPVVAAFASIGWRWGGH